MCKENSPFYLGINYKGFGDQHWHKRQRTDTDRLGKIMNKMAENANLSGKKNQPLSSKDHGDYTLCKENVPETQIIQLTGLRNLQSLNSYKKASLQQQKEMSHTLSSYSESQRVCSAEQVKPTTKGLQSFFEDAHFSSCTFNFGFPQSTQNLSQQKQTNILCQDPKPTTKKKGLMSSMTPMMTN